MDGWMNKAQLNLCKKLTWEDTAPPAQLVLYMCNPQQRQERSQMVHEALSSALKKKKFIIQNIIDENTNPTPKSADIFWTQSDEAHDMSIWWLTCTSYSSCVQQTVITTFVSKKSIISYHLKTQIKHKLGMTSKGYRYVKGNLLWHVQYMIWFVQIVWMQKKIKRCSYTGAFVI